jgi:hypothetical protein
MNRRTFATAFAATTALTACGVTGPVTPAQIVADAQGVVTSLATNAPLIFAAAAAAGKPVAQAAQDQVTGYLATAKAGLSTLVAGMPAPGAATSLAQQIDGYVNAALAFLTTIAPAIPALAPFMPVLIAANTLAPLLEAFVNQYLPASAIKVVPPPVPVVVTPAVALPRTKALAPMSVDQARQTLGIPVVR